MTTRNLFIAPIALAIALTVGCDDDDAPATRPDSGTVVPPDGGTTESLLESAARAMGGREAILAATAEQIEAHGRRYDAAEGRVPEETLYISEFDVTQTTDPGAPRVRRHLTHMSQFGIPQMYDFTDVIDDRVGYVDGMDFLFPFPGVGPQSPASRVVANLIHADLMSPLRLVRRALANPSAVRELPETGDGRRVLVLEEAGAIPFRIAIDATTMLPAAASIVEEHPPVGDAIVEASYADYRDTDGLKLPYTVTIRDAGLVIHEETRSAITLSPSDPPDYTVPEMFRAPWDDALATHGRLAPESLLNWQFFAFPVFWHDLMSAPPAITELAPHVFLIEGMTHHSLLVEMSDRLVIVETPLGERRSEVVLGAIRARFPDKPLTDIVQTHFHFDHCGGVRYYAAEGGMTLHVATPSVPFFERVFETGSHTVAPDRFESSPATVSIAAIESMDTLTDGEVSLELRRIATTHSDDMLVAYLPGPKILYNADMFNPNPFTDGMPAAGTYAAVARELYDAAMTAGLDVQTVVGAHGMGVSTFETLRIAAGR